MADLHGVPTDNPVLQWLLDTGNRLRYGQTEAERVEKVNRLSTPGVRDVAYDEGRYNHPAAERYTSAYAFGQKWAPPEALQNLLHGVSSGSRAAMHAVGVPGVGEEDPALREAENLGMKRGAEAAGPAPWKELLMGLLPGAN